MFYKKKVCFECQRPNDVEGSNIVHCMVFNNEEKCITIQMRKIPVCKLQDPVKAKSLSKLDNMKL